ncbi:MAG: carbonate dehydratase [Pontibacterium sp.]
MKKLQDLLDNNKAWAKKVTEQYPDFFEKLSKQQTPEYLWIGCSDSRVPATEIVNMMPGEIFVHRNVSNQVIHTDMNCLSVVQYAVEVLKVKHIMVVGHYGCGGVRAAIESKEPLGLIDNWLRHIRDVYYRHQDLLEPIADSHKKVDHLCEVNVIEQVKNVCNTTMVREAWDRGQVLNVHGWIYGLDNGLLTDLGINVTNYEELATEYEIAMNALKERIAS